MGEQKVTISVRGVKRDVYKQAKRLLVDSGKSMGEYLSDALEHENARVQGIEPQRPKADIDAGWGKQK